MSEPGNGRAVLVTGASSGIGEATALHLERVGFRVLAGHRRPEDGERLRDLAGPGLEPVRLDVTDEGDVAAVAERAGDRLHGLVNNAGIPVPGAVELLDPGELRRQLEVNLVAAVAVTQAVLPKLRAARGRVVNVTSVGGRVATPYMGAYHASKFGLEAISDSLRRELLPQGVRVIAVEPGSIKTPIWRKGRDHAAGADLPADLEPVYRRELEVALKAADETGERGLEPEVVAATIATALTARRPKPRYVVGRDARAMIAAQALLPTRVFDRLMRRSMGFGR
jgi:NAD(P)-dependent dehydrogenase (short-subunit alcohol dehydrogenase family)